MTVTLFHGDCLDILRTLPDGSVDAVVTDPPYGKGYHDGGADKLAATQWRGMTIAGDKKADVRIVPEIARVLRDGGALYLFSQWMVEATWIEAIRAAGLSVRNRIIWAKSHWGVGDLKTTYGPQHESILFASRGRHELIGKRCGDVWRDNATGIFRGGKVHPNEKPVELMAKAIEMSTKPGDTILDPFMGSGTTGVACVKTGCNFIGIEIDKGYYDIAERRIAEAQMQLPLLEVA